jgi:glycosyltransferase involved in cell wall biosynthesis
MLDYLQAIVKRYGVEEQVKFYPNASAEQKTDLLKKAKIYLHTMEGEHFGISIVEAMAYGCVPVVHDSGGMREFVPVHLRYSTLTQAVEKIASQIADWAPVKIQESIEIAAEFSLQRFSDRFMKYFAEYTGRI